MVSQPIALAPVPLSAPARFVVSATVAALAHGPVVLPMVHDPGSAAAARFRVLRHRVQASGRARVIAVTSARPREGVTTCALNLALAIAERQAERTLLVEANRLRPRLAEVLGAEVPRCFETQLADAQTSEWSVIATARDRLHVLAVNPLLATGAAVTPRAYRSLIEAAKARGYDHIIFDCSDVSGGGDLSLIADMVDGVLLCAMARKTHRKELRRALDRLAPTPVLGVVLNGEVRDVG